MNNENNPFQEMMNTWMSAGKQFQDNFQDKKTSNPYETIIEAQNKIVESQQEMFKNMFGSQNMGMPNFSKFDATSNMQQAWEKMLEQWGKKSQPFGSQPNPLNTYAQMMKSSEAYSKMFEVFQPLFSQTGIPSNQKISDLIDSEKMKVALDSILGFFKTDQNKDFQTQIRSYILYLTQSLTKYADQSDVYLKQLSHAIPELFTKDLNGKQHMNHQIYSNFKKSISHLLTMVPPSKEKEMLILMLDMQERYLAYMDKSQEVNSLITNTANNAINKAFKKLMDANDQKFSPILMDELYNTWINMAEEDLTKLFSSDIFSKLQGDILSTGGKVKSLIEKQMESVIEHLPIAPRSEIDNLSKIVHELRTKVRNIEKENKVLKSELEGLKSPAAKTTTQAAKTTTTRKTTARKTTTAKKTPAKKTTTKKTDPTV